MDPEIIAKIAESKIQEAIEEGKFDNLPGKGKPIVFDEDASVPAHLRMANKVLKNAGVLPDWIQAQKDIVTERREAQSLRARLIHENNTKRPRLLDWPAEHAIVRQYAEWHAKARAGYLRRLKSVNSSILKFSLMAPSTAQPFTPHKIDEEMAAFDAEFPPLPQHPHVEPPADNRAEDSRLRGVARTRYQNGGAGPVRSWGKDAANRQNRPDPRPAFGGFGGSEGEDIKRADVPEDQRRR